MSDDFLNIPKIFEPLQDSSGFSDGVSKTSEKVPKQCWWLFVLQTMWFWISADWRIHPHKKHEWEACVSHSHVHYLDVSFVFKSVGANGFSYFLFLLFCARKWINLKTFGGWEKLTCVVGGSRDEKSKCARVWSSKVRTLAGFARSSFLFPSPSAMEKREEAGPKKKAIVTMFVEFAR